MLSPPLTVFAGIPESVLVTYDISFVATIGNTVGVDLPSDAYVTVVFPDSVSLLNFPLTSTDALIVASLYPNPPTNLAVQGQTASPGKDHITDATPDLSWVFSHSNTSTPASGTL
jgi:hypothetical protein